MDGMYLVKLVYQILEMEERAESWSVDLFWSKEVLPKAGTFAWLDYKYIILTGEHQNRLEFYEPSRCVMCGEEEETTDHFLLNCKVAQECWEMVRKGLDWQAPRQPTLKKELISWPMRLK